MIELFSGISALCHFFYYYAYYFGKEEEEVKEAHLKRK